MRYEPTVTSPPRAHPRPAEVADGDIRWHASWLEDPGRPTPPVPGSSQPRPRSLQVPTRGSGHEDRGPCGGGGVVIRPPLEFGPRRRCRCWVLVGGFPEARKNLRQLVNLALV